MLCAQVLRRRFPTRRYDVDKLVQFIRLSGLRDSEITHLCAHVFQDESALDDFVSAWRDGNETAERFLRSKLPHREEPIRRDFFGKRETYFSQFVELLRGFVR